MAALAFENEERERAAAGRGHTCGGAPHCACSACARKRGGAPSFHAAGNQAMQSIRRKSSSERAPETWGGIPVGGATDPAEARADRFAESVVANQASRPASGNPDAQAGSAPIPHNVRAELEPALGADLSGVRVHSDHASHAAAHDLNARAFTYGSDIWLGAGQSVGDLGLMAHESAHVAEARSSASSGTVLRRQTPVQATAAAPAAVQGQAEIDSVFGFQEAVFRKAINRLDANIVKLEEWRRFINTQFDDVELTGQVAATESQALYSQAVQRGRVEYFEHRAAARSPASIAFDEGVITGKINSGCEACHESNTVWQWNAQHRHEFENLPTVAERMAGLANYAEYNRFFKAATEPGGQEGQPAPALAAGAPAAQTSAAQAPAPPVPVDIPKPRTGLCGDLPPEAETPSPRSLSPAAQMELDAVRRIGPVLQPLGPQGYRILPTGVFSELYDKGPAQIRSLVMSNLDTRQDKYRTLKAMIAADMVPYEELCPIVDELLPSASDSVQALVLTDIYASKVVEVILDILLALVGAALLLLAFLFPPAAVLIVGAAVALTQIGIGLRDYRRGTQYELGTGAGVYSPSQEASATGLMVGGLINVVTGAVSLGMTSASLARLPKPGMQLVAPGRPGVMPGQFSPLADGTYIAFHPENPNLCIVADGETLSFEANINGEWQQVATARSPWPAGSPPPGAMTWEQWTAARGWTAGGMAPRPPATVSMVPSLGGAKPPLLLGSGEGSMVMLPSGPGEGTFMLGPGQTPFGALPSGPTPFATLPPGFEPFGLLPSGPAPFPALPPGYQPFGLLPPGPAPFPAFPPGYLPFGWLPSGPAPFPALPPGYQPFGLFPSGPAPMTVAEQSAHIERLLARKQDLAKRITQAESNQRSAADQIDALEKIQKSKPLSETQAKALKRAKEGYDDARKAEDTLRGQAKQTEQELTDVRRSVVKPKTWQEHETAVFERQKADYPGAQVGEQVTMDVRNVATGEAVEIRADVVRAENGEAHLVDAKFSEKNDLTKGKLDSSVFQPNQQKAYGWISSGTKVEVIPRGPNAQAMGLKDGVPVKVAPKVEVHVNSPEGIRVRDYKDTL